MATVLELGQSVFKISTQFEHVYLEFLFNILKPDKFNYNIAPYDPNCIVNANRNLAILDQNYHRKRSKSQFLSKEVYSAKGQDNVHPKNYVIQYWQVGLN